MKRLELEKTENFIIDLAKKVGAFQKNKFRTALFKKESKSSAIDLVTDVDKESEKSIIQAIKSRFPDHSIVAEESGEESGFSDYRWVIDPLDGTVNFAQGIPIFSISIALQMNNETLLGVVHAPMLAETYHARLSNGSFLNHLPIHVSEKFDVKKSILATGFPYDKGTNPINNVDNASKLIPQIGGIRRLGSAAYDLCLVANGSFHAYWELNLKIWDICAGALIVKEAGGVIHSFREDREHSIIAGSKSSVNFLKKQIH